MYIAKSKIWTVQSVSINQLVKIKGVEKCIVMIDYDVKNPIIDNILTKLIESIPLMPISANKKFASKDFEKYLKKSISDIPEYYRKSKEQKNVLNSASGNAILICVGEGNSFFNKDILYWVNKNLAQTSSIPKVFFIQFQNNNAHVRYKNIISSLLRGEKIVDVDILQISKRSRPTLRKKCLKQNLLKSNYLVHQFNPFTRVYKMQKLTKRVKWFQPKLKNLHKYQFRINVVNNYYDNKKATISDKVYVCGN